MQNHPVTPRKIAEALARTIERDPNPQATVRDAQLTENAPSLVLDVADHTGANGGRTFIIGVREIDPPEGSADDVTRLAALLRKVDGNHDRAAAAIAESLINHGVVMYYAH
jgi:hypothetical protein